MKKNDLKFWKILLIYYIKKNTKSEEKKAINLQPILFTEQAELWEPLLFSENEAISQIKGQLISGCLYDFLNFPKKTMQTFHGFLP